MTSRQLSLFQLPEQLAPLRRAQSLKYPVWTENKARLIERYLYYFVLITKHGAYIDGFAGPQSEELSDIYSARLVLESEPRWLNTFFLCDSDGKKAVALRQLRDTQPKKPRRHIEVLEGDFNLLIHQILKSDRLKERTATFCLLDQRTFECRWDTVKLLAGHKRQSPKVELFYFFCSGWINRALAAQKDTVVVRQWWGRNDWESLRRRSAQDLAGAVSDRFCAELGYKSAYPYPIYGRSGGRGQLMYHMIHATDHPEAPNLMARAYRQATHAREPIEQLRLEFEEFKTLKKSGQT